MFLDLLFSSSRPEEGRYRQLWDSCRRPLPALGAKLWPPVRSVRGPRLRSVYKLKAHVLIATTRTSGRTSPPNTGMPMFVRVTSINPSFLYATTTQRKHSNAARETCQRCCTNFEKNYGDHVAGGLA